MQRIVPWIDFSEWQLVFDLLYSPDSAENLRGVNRVKSWLSRGKVPSAIEITSILVEIGLQDQPTRYSTCSKREISLLLSMAMIRFVNSVVDASQRGAVASSAIAVAEQIGLPLWFVEIRHEATHDKIPSIETLRKARVEVLRWLYDHYWKVQELAIRENMSKLSKLVDEYCDKRIEQVDSTGSTNFRKVQKVLQTLKSALTLETFGDLVPVLVQSILNYSGDERSVEIWSPLLKFCDSEWTGFAYQLLLHLSEFNHVAKDSQANWASHLIHDYGKTWDRVSLDKLSLKLLKTPQELQLKTLVLMRKRQLLSKKHGVLLEYLLEMQKIAQDQSVPPRNEQTQVDEKEMDQELQLLSSRIRVTAAPMEIDESEPEKPKRANSAGWTIVSDWTKCPIGQLPVSSTQNFEFGSEFDELAWLHEQGYLFIPNLNANDQLVTVESMVPMTVESSESKTIRLF